MGTGSIEMSFSRNFVEFCGVYDDLTKEVENSRHQFVSDHLENWFELIDETPQAQKYVKVLESAVFMDFLSWMPRVTGTTPSPISDRHKEKLELSWPKGPDRRLGMQLSVFRKIADRSITANEFGTRFLKKDIGPMGGTTMSSPADEVVEYIFLPMARELRRKLEVQFALAREPTNKERTIPASDRVVSLDHNSREYGDAVAALKTLEQTIREANDYPDSDDKEQRLAELSATRQILQSARVRVAAVVALVVPAITYLTTHFVGTAINVASTAVIEKLTALFGIIF
jgi:hypothetical protein